MFPTWLRCVLPALALGSPVAAQDNAFAAAWPATDFSRLTIDLSEVMSGGQPRDGIAAITGPDLIPVAAEGRIEEAGLTLSSTEGQASALDTSRIGDGRDVGKVRVRDGAGRDVIHDIPFAFHAFHPEGVRMMRE
jgi:hypothetical protein